MKKRIVVVSVCITLLLVVGLGVGYWTWQNSNPQNNAEVKKKVRPSGTYTDLTKNTPDEQGVVVSQDTKSTESLTVEGVNSKLSDYFKSQKQSSDSVTIQAAYGEYARGLDNSGMTIWGPSESGSIQPLEYTDRDYFNCDDLDRVNAPPQLVGGKCYGPEGIKEYS